jgi:predicted nucleic acid-binding protein
MLYLIDTCIWRDFYEDRYGKNGYPLGKYATEFFMNVLAKKDRIIFSETLIMELKNDYSENEINDLLNLLFLNGVLVRIEITKTEYLEAKKLSSERTLPFIDCLNAVQARNHEAALVSQDKHFKKLSDITRILRP